MATIDVAAERDDGGDPVLEVENLHTQFPTDRGVVRAVDGVDLTIESGEIVGLVGESGSGKSVLAESVVGIVEEPGEIVEGDVRFDGESLLAMSDARRQAVRGGRISMVFQDPMNSLNPTLTVGEQIAETVRLHQDVGESVSLPAELKRKIVGAAKNGDAWRRAIEMLEAVEIPEPEARAADFPHQFSGGMRQRAMIAMALSCEPDLLVADEPTTALDVTIQAQILEELEGLKDEFDTSILLITHDLAVVAETCDRVNVMYAGEIVERAETEALFADPQHPYTQGLIASTPQLDEPDRDLQPIQGNVPDLIDIPYACHFAPRCPEAERECFEIEPEFRPVGDSDAPGDGGTHEAACLRRGPDGERL
ncbi:ATP-binding cassette domain-containing protein [Halobaculum sp. WSA2]|uniref:Nickel import system ATP-binding protein NikD n=1 Tax=Halobaculum saliterrae TaxID=2073113 RepID=A0A6B0SMM7_9EURY|nr:ABC transporter ATP-binding protein [Halobaculum saliterrae]MXR39985.1 ATP-binding cassette domain-containing protein [Halobaculum saliterrae]